MHTIALNEGTLAGVRRHLRAALPELISSHIAEALAASLGYKSSRALSAAAKSCTGVDIQSAEHMSTLFHARAVELNPGMPSADIVGSKIADILERTLLSPGRISDGDEAGAHTLTIPTLVSVQRRMFFRLLAPMLQGSIEDGVSLLDLLPTLIESIGDNPVEDWVKIREACTALLAQCRMGHDFIDALGATQAVLPSEIRLIRLRVSATDRLWSVLSRCEMRLDHNRPSERLHAFWVQTASDDLYHWRSSAERDKWTDRYGRMMAVHVLSCLPLQDSQISIIENTADEMLLCDDERIKVAEEILRGILKGLQRGADISKATKALFPFDEWMTFGPGLVMKPNDVNATLHHAADVLMGRIEVGRRRALVPGEAGNRTHSYICDTIRQLAEPERGRYLLSFPDWMQSEIVKEMTREDAMIDRW